MGLRRDSEDQKIQGENPGKLSNNKIKGLASK